MKNDQKGFGILEVVIALGITAFLVVSIGKVLDSVNRLYAASENKTKAMAYAQESLEIFSDNKNIFFVCSCNTETGCFGSTCVRGGDGQSCELFDAYTSCWTQFPNNQINQTHFYLQRVGSDWYLNALAPGAEETIASNPNFKRQITITNVLRDEDGNITQTGTPDFNTKEIKVTVKWTDRGDSKSTSLSTILTAWENL